MRRSRWDRWWRRVHRWARDWMEAQATPRSGPLPSYAELKARANHHRWSTPTETGQ